VRPSFLPERLRPHAQRRRSRRSLLLIALLPATLALTPLWRIQAVDLDGCASLPSEVTASLQQLVGRPALTVSPQWVRHQLEQWPEVAEVEVRLELPGTLRVAATRKAAQGSVAAGQQWRAVTRSGELAGSLDQPLEPVLEGVRCRPAEMRRALSVAERCATATGGRVESIREVTPSDFELRLWPAGAEQPVTLHLRPEPTAGERYWFERIARGEARSSWADLRWDDRLVLGGVG